MNRPGESQEANGGKKGAPDCILGPDLGHILVLVLVPFWARFWGPGFCL